MSRQFDFSISLEVNDDLALLHAARNHPDAEGMATEEFYDDAGDIDIKVCLVMLLDPSILPGCEIQDSGAEEIEVHDVDFGGERN